MTVLQQDFLTQAKPARFTMVLKSFWLQERNEPYAPLSRDEQIILHLFHEVSDILPRTVTKIVCLAIDSVSWHQNFSHDKPWIHVDLGGISNQIPVLFNRPLERLLIFGPKDAYATPYNPFFDVLAA